MSAIRFTVVLLFGLALASCLAGGVQAQEPVNPNPNPLEQILPSNANGTPIAESQRVWAYVAAVVGFIVVFAVAWFGVRLLAFLLVIGSFLGGLVLAVLALHEKAVTTWEQLAVAVLYLGIAAGVSAITANLYLIKGGVEKKE
jgi:hypothetical protein